MSIETAARHARHQLFDRVSRAYRCRQILLGHHADDRVETILLNLFRGSGRLTLPRSPSHITINRRALTFIRPLYPVWRPQIDAYIVEHDLAFREDPTNAVTDHLRNRLRHQLIPLLNDIFERDIAKTISRAAIIAGEEDEYLHSLLEGLDLEPPLQPGKLSTTRLRALPLTLRRRAVHDWLKQHSIPNITFEKIEECLTLLDLEGGPAKINLPGNRHARRRARALSIE